jgi:hypothetical protein
MGMANTLIMTALLLAGVLAAHADPRGMRASELIGRPVVGPEGKPLGEIAGEGKTLPLPPHTVQLHSDRNPTVDGERARRA